MTERYTAPVDPVISAATRNTLGRVVWLLERIIEGNQTHYCLTWAQRHMSQAIEAIDRDSNDGSFIQREV